MEIETRHLHAAYDAARRRRASSAEHLARRARPAVFDFDYLILGALGRDMSRLLSVLPPPATPRVALDVGSAFSPYRAQIERAGYTVQTLDVDPASGADHIGPVEHTGLADAAFDLIVCTQVLEHVRRPDEALTELRRILKPGGHLILALPHVWPYHPCPRDFWRFTQEGVVELAAGSGFEVERLLGAGGCGTTLFQTLNLMVYGLLGAVGAPVYLVTNGLGRLADALAPSPLFCMNFTCLARRPATV
jgi:SAM-dependent methyltransferase